MTANEVIQKGEALTSDYGDFLQESIMVLGIMAGAFFLFTIVYLLIRKFVTNKKTSEALIALCTFVLVMSGIVGIFFSIHQKAERIKQDTAAYHEWVTKDVYTYAKTQDYTDYPLESIEVVKYSDADVTVVKYRGEDGVNRTLEQPGAQKKFAVKLVYDATPGTGEFVRFYDIPVDLGNGFTPGAYGLSVHLNEKE